MFRKICILLGLFAAISAARLPLGVVQFGAWVDMFSELFERTGSVRESFSNTFNGDYRCAGCDFVSASTAKAEEKAAAKGAAEEARAGGATFGKLDSMTVAERKRYFGRQPTAAVSCLARSPSSTRASAQSTSRGWSQACCRRWMQWAHKYGTIQILITAHC